MSIPIRTYVDVSITRQTGGVTRAGFGTPLVLGEVTSFADRTKYYTDISGVALDFDVASDIYIKANMIFNQNPKVKGLKVGRKLGGFNAIQNYSFNAAASAGTYTITVGANTTANIAYNANVATIKSTIEALANVTTVTVTQITASQEYTIEFTGVDGNKHWDNVVVNIGSLTGVSSVVVSDVQFGSTAETWADALNNVTSFDNDWYAVCITSSADADILAIAGAVQAMSKIFIALSTDEDILTSSTTDIASVLNTAGYTRTALIFSKQSDNHLDAGWIGKLLPKKVGEATWAFKEIEGGLVSKYESFERNFAIAKKANIYHISGGARITDFGTVASGEFIDNMLNIDFLTARISEDIWQAIISADKIPYTDAGIGIIRGILEGRLSSSVNQGILDTYSVEVPKVIDVPITERANRYLPDVKFNGRLQGAIQQIEIRGKVSV